MLCCPTGPAGQQAQRRDKGAPLRGSRLYLQLLWALESLGCLPPPHGAQESLSQWPWAPFSSAGKAREAPWTGRMRAPSWFRLGPQAPLP